MPGLKVGDSFPDDVAFSYIPASPETCDFKACGIPQKLDASKGLLYYYCDTVIICNDFRYPSTSLTMLTTPEFKTKKIVLVSVPGAFTPTCSASHLPSFLDNKPQIKAKGIDHVIIIAYNDAYVMSGWAKANGATDDFMIFASDADAKFSKSIGWTMGERTARYAILIDHGKVVYAGIDSDAGSTQNSDANAILAHL